MSDATGIDEAPLSVLLDLRHPLAYLALEPARQLGDALGIAINWLPLQVPPLRAPSEPGPEDDRGIRHRRHRARAIAREIETYAAARGLVLREYYREPDPSVLNLAWLWLREARPEALDAFLAEAFRAYWALELDPASPSAVASLLGATVADAEPFEAWCSEAGEALAASLAADLRERGLFGTPAYVLEDEVFLGRQHLPMIRWILQGRVGPGPI